MYPVLKSMTTSGLLKKEDRKVNGKIRKYYSTTAIGSEILKEARVKASELFSEINE